MHFGGMTDVPMVTKMSIAGSQIDASYQSWSKWKWVQQTLCVTDKVKQAFVKENKIIKKKKKQEAENKKRKKSKSVKSLRYMDEFLCRLMSSHYLNVASYILMWEKGKIHI